MAVPILSTSSVYVQRKIRILLSSVFDQMSCNKLFATMPDNVVRTAKELSETLKNMNQNTIHMTEMVNIWNATALLACKQNSIVKLPLFINLPKVFTPDSNLDEETSKIIFPDGEITFQKVAYLIKTFVLSNHAGSVRQAIQTATNRGISFFDDDNDIS